MQLKTITLSGFKSFADLTKIPLNSAINAVVGPNGCGKSNVVDAIRWVTGEISAKQLRGGTMQDVIFNGTQARKPVARAAVELLFENNRGLLRHAEYGAYTEIALRRELTRDGQSAYFINGVRARRKDIIDIFMGTGLGPRSYAVIEQGMIARLVEAKPDELRAYLEEVAGIAKYKDRRRETESRLDRTQENLDRVQDIMTELERQLRQLKRQSNAAERYQQLTAEQRQLQLTIYGLKWEVLAAERTTVQTRCQTLLEQQQELVHQKAQYHETLTALQAGEAEQRDKLAQFQEQYYAGQAKQSALEQQMAQRREQVASWQQLLTDQRTRRDDLSTQHTAYKTELSELETVLQALTPELTREEITLTELTTRLTETQTVMQQAEETWQTAQTERNEHQQALTVASHSLQHAQEGIAQLRQQQEMAQTTGATLATQRIDITPFAEALADAKSELEAVQTAIATDEAQQREYQTRLNDAEEKRQECQQHTHQLQKQLAALTALQDVLLGRQDKTRNAWLAQHGWQDLPRFGETLTVAAGWEKAAQTVMAEVIDALCVTNGWLAETATAVLAEPPQGRLLLIEAGLTDTALQSPNVKAEAGEVNATPVINDIKATLVNDRNDIGTSKLTHDSKTLADYVQSSWAFPIDLTQIFVASDLEAAQAMRAQLTASQSVITPDGVWMGRYWRLSVQPEGEAAGFVERAKDIETLNAQRAERDNALAELNTRISDLKTQSQQLAATLQERRTQYQQLSSRHTQAAATFAQRQAEQTALEQKQAALETEISARASKLQEQQRALEALQVKQQTLESEKNHRNMACEEALTAYQTAKQTWQTIQTEQATGKARYDALHVKQVTTEKQRQLLQQTMTQTDGQLTAIQTEIDQLTARLADSDTPEAELTVALDQVRAMQATQEDHITAQQAQIATHHQHVAEAQTWVQRLDQQLQGVQNELSSQQAKLEHARARQEAIDEQLSELGYTTESVTALLVEQREANQESPSLQACEEQLASVSHRISRLGAINLAAIEEYETVHQRYVELEKQHQDLTEAINILKEAIQTINRETKTQFKATFDAVNEKFQAAFPQIFSGGQAGLVLTDEEILTAGVIVKAQPPGKRNATIHMLSGGEKALTALALVFALFQLNPAPFCVLDEVDAPLDDLNVGRFCHLVKQMAEQIQFIVISHNKLTIEMAHQLMGITMQEPGVSRLVAVDMAEALSMIDAEAEAETVAV